MRLEADVVPTSQLAGASRHGILGSYDMLLDLLGRKVSLHPKGNPIHSTAGVRGAEA